jgi:hypothetical protein
LAKNSIEIKVSNLIDNALRLITIIRMGLFRLSILRERPVVDFIRESRLPMIAERLEENNSEISVKSVRLVDDKELNC